MATNAADAPGTDASEDADDGYDPKPRAEVIESNGRQMLVGLSAGPYTGDVNVAVGVDVVSADVEDLRCLFAAEVADAIVEYRDAYRNHLADGADGETRTAGDGESKVVGSEEVDVE